MTEKHKKGRELLDLNRLARLSDVVYALILFRLYLLLPRPEDKDWHWKTLAGMISENGEVFLVVLLATIIVIIYWVQNNTLINKLKSTDSIHTGLLILQLFFVLIFLYSIRMGIEFGANPSSRAMESVIVAMMGILGATAWVYAAKGRRFLQDEVTGDMAEGLFIRNLAEPLTALFTLLFAWSGWLLWEFSWFAYPVFSILLNRYGLSRIQKHMESGSKSP